jgi:hypothetical protein
VLSGVERGGSVVSGFSGRAKGERSCCRLSSACGGGCGRNERNEEIIMKAGGEGYVVEEKQR